MLAAVDTHSLAFPCSRVKVAVFSAVVALFALAGLNDFNPHDVADRMFLGVRVFLVIFVVGVLIQALRGKPSLVLTRTGFQVSTGFTTNTYSWPECENFAIRDFFGPTTIAFTWQRSREGLIFNMYKARTVEICETLRLWSDKYGNGA